MREAIVLLSVLILIAAAGGASRARGESGQRVAVSIAGQRFVPASITIDVGDTVVWTNRDDRDHTVAADDGSFASGKLKAGRSYAHRFTRAGTYAYTCSLHPREKGRIVVKAARR